MIVLTAFLLLYILFNLYFDQTNDKGEGVDCNLMGYFKKLLEEKGKLKEDINCRYCGSEELKFTKHIGYGNIMGVVYHYKATCLSCERKYHVKRSKRVYDFVKDDLWIKSKSYKRKELMGELTKLKIDKHKGL